MGIYDQLLRMVLNRLSPYLEFICFYLIYPGGTIYGVVQYFYVRFFNLFVRQSKPARRTQRRFQGNKPEAVLHASDCESSLVVGRNRRITRSTAKTYLRRTDVFQRNRSKSISMDAFPSTVLLLTGNPGEPGGDQEWLFTLIGCPEDCPPNWMNEHYDEIALQRSWSRVALPSHWQLQGFDVPLYTNTTYPFQFDPPRARRNGLWSDTACDLGLGAEPFDRVAVSSKVPGGLRIINPDEPGENATGLYRCKFSLAALLGNTTTYSRGNGGVKSAKRSQKKHTAEPTPAAAAESCRLFLVFAGVDSCMSVWLNGHYVGYSQDSCLPVEFDITEACGMVGGERSVWQEHTLAVQVSRWCDGSYLEDQDKWWLSGIYREVYIEKRPEAFISDFEVTSTVKTRTTITRVKDGKNILTFSGPAGTGEVTGPDFTVDVLISVLAEGVRTTSNICESPGSHPHGVRVEIWQDIMSDERPVAMFTKQLSSASALPNRLAADTVLKDRPRPPAGEDVLSPISPGVLTVQGSVPDPILWTAETPFLYTLVISLYPTLEDAEKDTNDFHSITHKIGFRKVSIGGPDNVLRVNDSPILIAGINRHEFNARTGRAVSKKSMLEDAILLQKLNFNAVRGAHYPQHPYWLEVCDEVGLYVVDEANIESHGFQVLGQPVGYLASQPEWETAIVTRVTRMFERDKNHACVIGWSLGNESGHGATHDLLARWLRLRDPSRFVQVLSKT